MVLIHGHENDCVVICFNCGHSLIVVRVVVRIRVRIGRGSTFRLVVAFLATVKTCDVTLVPVSSWLASVCGPFVSILFEVPTVRCLVTDLATAATTAFELLCKECGFGVVLVFHIFHDSLVLALEGLLDGLDIEGLRTITFFEGLIA